MQHTDTRLSVEETITGWELFATSTGRPLFQWPVINEADARRLAAAWNACATIPTAALEAGALATLLDEAAAAHVFLATLGLGATHPRIVGLAAAIRAVRGEVG